MFIRPLAPVILGGIALSIFFAVKRPILAYIVDKSEIVNFIFIFIEIK